MLIGDYIVVILDADGRVLGEHVLTASTGHPQVGHELKLGDGPTYVVERVVHESDGNELSRRTYSYARVFVSEKPRSADEDEPDRSRRVLPFADPGPAASGVILPASLIAVLVACGYRAQATEFKSRRRLTGRLVRDGYGWFVERESATELRRLSRLAKRYFAEAQSLILARAGGVVGAVIESEFSRPADPIPPPAARLRAAPRALRSA
jgi:hypothetical protein